MHLATAARLTQRIRERCGIERSRIATPAELLAAAAAGVAWTTALLTSLMPGYYDGLFTTGDLTFAGDVIETPQPAWRLRSISYAAPGDQRLIPLRVVTLAEYLELAPGDGRPRVATLATGFGGGATFGGGILVGPRPVTLTSWEWVVCVAILPSLLDQSSSVPLPSVLWEEAAVVYGAIQLLEKQELSTGPLWTHLQALEARLREVTLSREDSGQAGVRERRLEPLEESLWL